MAFCVAARDGRSSPLLGSALASFCLELPLPGLQMDELLSQEPSPLLFLPFPPDTLSLAEATGAFASQESKRIPEIILKRLTPGEWGSCPVPGARGEPPPPRPGAGPAGPRPSRGRGGTGGRVGPGEVMVGKEADKQICFIRRCIS